MSEEVLTNEVERLTERVNNQQRSIDSLLMSNQNYANRNVELTAKIQHLQGNYNALVELIHKYEIELEDWLRSKNDNGRKPSKNVSRFRT